MKLKHFVCALAAIVFTASLGLAQPAAKSPAQILITNTRIFNGTSDKLADGLNVLVEGNKITKISAQPIPTNRRADTVIIDAQGRTLMPGLIDLHTHMMMTTMPQMTAMMADIGYLNLVAGKDAEAMLLRGFTTARDMGGPAFGLKRAIDDGTVNGPRIYPSGAMISQTGGHGDFRFPFEVPKTIGDPLSHAEKIGVAAIADSPDEVRLRSREQLRQGATQLKLMAGGGVASDYDPLDVAQYTEPEFRAAVEAAENWGTYVTVHAYTPRAIKMAVDAGVKCIEHGQLMDEASAKLISEKGVWLCLQPFLDDQPSTFADGSRNRLKQLEMYAGTDTAYKLAKKYKIKTAWGTDTLFNAENAAAQGGQLAKLARWYSPFEVLKMATHDNAELLALSGPRNPYPGKLGVIEEGALADLLLVDGDPIANLKLIEDPAKNLLVIMKDGKIFKNALK